ncbi:MAG: CDP-archaeol synthase [Alphaproteobacteria bacterium]|nr:CDP-archaeol synthase [Alphaproteobacteria bacterium]
MKTRLIAGLTGLAILLPAVIWGGLIAVHVIVSLSLLICVYEYASMAFPDDRNAAMGWLALGVGTHYAGLVWLAEKHATMMALFGVATLIFVTLRPGEDLHRATDRAGRYLLGVTWVGLLVFLVLLRALPDGLAWCFVALGISWLGDTGAYFAGRSFGSRKLYERISPNKTVEGMVGGVITATIGVFVITAIGLPSANPVDCLILGVFGCIGGVLGDLAESMVKRTFDVKDAGNIMPGHGGLLDRIDSVLFVGALVYGYATLVKG